MGENHEKAYCFGLHQLRNCSSPEIMQGQGPPLTAGLRFTTGAIEGVRIEPSDRIESGGRNRWCLSLIHICFRRPEIYHVDRARAYQMGNARAVGCFQPVRPGAHDTTCHLVCEFRGRQVAGSPVFRLIRGCFVTRLCRSSSLLIIISFTHGNVGRAPVSYTHLDVYKRQVSSSPSLTR